MHKELIMNTEIINRVPFSEVQLHSHSHEWARQIARDFLAAFKYSDAPAYPEALERFSGLRAAHDTLYWCGLVGSSKCGQECQSLVLDIQATMLYNIL